MTEQAGAALSDHLGVSVLVPGRDAGVANEMAKLVLAEGMSPDQLATLACDGIERRDRALRLPHRQTPRGRRCADERYADVTLAFDELGTTDVPPVSYALDEVVAAVLDGSSS